MDDKKVTSINKNASNEQDSFSSDAMAAIEAKIFFTNGEEKISCSLLGNVKDLALLKAIIDQQFAEKIVRDSR